MGDTFLQHKLHPYDGSQDVSKNPILIDAKDIIYSDNIVYTNYATKKKRPGLTYLFDDFKTNHRRILAMHDFWRLGQQRLVIWDGKYLKSIDTSKEVVDDISSGFTLPTDEAVTFLPYYGVLIIFFQDRNTIPKYWTQSGQINNLSPTAPLAPFGRVWLNRLVVPDPSVPGRVLFSKTNDFTDFTTGDAYALDLDVNDGDPDGITAIFPVFFGVLYITKRLSTYKVFTVSLDDGSYIITYSKISEGVGCISHNAVVATEQNIIFPSDAGWHQMESSDKISELDTSLLSRTIQPIWRDETNFKRAKYMQSIYDRQLNSVLCSFPAFSANYSTDVWGFSLITKSWYRWSDYKQTAFCKYIQPDTKKLVTAVGGSTGTIGFIDDTVKKDYDKNIPPIRIVSGIIAPSGAPDEEYQYNYLGSLYVPQFKGEFKVSMKIDGLASNVQTFNMEDTSLGDTLGENFILGQSILGGVPNIAYDKVRIGGNGMFHQFIITHEDNSESGVDFELLGLILDLSSINKGTGKRVA